MAKLQGKVAVITGANSGIGYASAQEFLAQGAQVVITGRKKEAIDQAVTNLGKGVTGFIADQSRLSDIDALVAYVTNTHGKVDILFVNAGIAQFAPVEQSSEEFFDNTMNINFKGVFFTVQKFLSILNDGAAILFNTSIAGVVGMPNSSVYAASKAALASFTKVLASELSARGIRVNSVSPGPITTPIYDKLGFPQEMIDGFSKNLSSKTLLGRFGRPEEVAQVVAFLASNEASYITGVELAVDGGVTVNPGDR